MKDRNYEALKEMVQIIQRMNKTEIEEIEELVDDIIKYKNKDESTISSVFDKMLSMVFVAEEDLKETYYKLVNYTKKFNKELSKDYEEFFIEQFKDIDDDELDL